MNKEQIQQNIKNMEAEIAKMKEELSRPGKFVFKYPKDEAILVSAYKVSKDVTGEDKDYLEHYRYRISEDNAKADLLRNKQINFIGALFEQIDVNYAEGIDWEDPDTVKYFISYNHSYNTWNIASHYNVNTPGVVYTTKRVAQIAKKLLSSGQVTYPTT